jgi:hypothetical protein
VDRRGQVKKGRKKKERRRERKKERSSQAKKKIHINKRDNIRIT